MYVRSGAIGETLVLGLPHLVDRLVQVPQDVALVVEDRHALLRPVHPAKPDGLVALQVADDDPIDVPLPDRDLVDPDHGWPGLARADQLLPHVELVHLLDRVPVEAQIVRHLHLEIDPQVAAREIADAARRAVVPRAVWRATRAADRFYGRRLRGMTRAWGSPKTPSTVRLGGSQETGRRHGTRVERGVAKSCRNFRPPPHTPQGSLSL